MDKHLVKVKQSNKLALIKITKLAVSNKLVTTIHNKIKHNKLNHKLIPISNKVKQIIILLV